MKSQQPTILVYNPISGRGHLDSWNAMFIELLLKNGWRVLSLTPDPSALLTRLSGHEEDHIKRLQILPWDNRWTNWGLRLSQNCVRIKFIIDRYYHKRPGYEVTLDMPWFRYWKKRSLQVIVPFLIRSFYSIYRLSGGVRSLDSLLPSVQSEAQFLLLINKAYRIKSALKKAKWKPDIALNMYMDFYSTGEKEWAAFDSCNELSWVGIRFVPPPEPHEAWYGLSSWKGMFLLDENKVLTYEKALPQKFFQYLPDISDIRLPENPTKLAIEIKKRAQGRKIVFLGGSIGGQKNLSNWYQMIALADPNDWFFVQIGEVHINTLTPEDLKAFNQVLASPPENLLLCSEYLKDEQSFNDVIAGSDIIFAVYRNFPYSSNMIGKAAHFKKPILVSDRFLMGERVEQYRIGELVKEDSPSEMLSALSLVKSRAISEESFLSYCQDYSPQAVATKLNSLLGRCLNRCPP